MKRILCIIVASLLFGLQTQYMPAAILRTGRGANIQHRILHQKYIKALQQLQQHLDAATSVTAPDKTDLINKLLIYFSKKDETSIALKNKQAQLIYTAITSLYNELLSLDNSVKKTVARKFAEQALGKILLTIPEPQAPAHTD